MTVSGLSSWMYYSAVTGGEVHESTQPAPSSMAESANLLGTILPVNIAENGGTELPSMMERIRLLNSPISSAPFDDTWFWVMVTASSFLGVSWVILGVMGIWQKKRRSHRMESAALGWTGTALLFWK